MSRQTGKQHETVEDALARQVEHRRGPASRLAEALRELGQVDRAVYQAVARTPTAELDGPVRWLANAANYSRLWLGSPPRSRCSAAGADAGRRWRVSSRSV